jgi:hypothetical protein
VPADSAGRVNWARVLPCGLLAGLIWTVLSSFVTALTGRAFSAALPDNRLAAPSAPLVVFLLAVNLVEGIWAMWLYAAIRPRFGAAPRTAIIAGCAWWAISTLVDLTWGSFGLVPMATLAGPILASLPAVLLATIAGAWRYSE